MSDRLSATNIDYQTTTNPEGVLVKFIGGHECATPCALEVKRESDLRVDIMLAGHTPTHVLIQSKLGRFAFGNILLGGGVVQLSTTATALATGFTLAD